MAMTHIPPQFDDWQVRYMTPSEGSPTDTSSQVVDAVLSNAPQIADGLQGIEVSQHVVAGVRSAHIAEAEGVLPLWAAYRRWGLDRQPTTHPYEVPWAQWSTGEDWQPFDEFVDQVAAEAPGDSRFVRDMVATATANIQNARDGVLAASEFPDIATGGSTSDEPSDLIIEVSPEILALGESLAQRRDELLAGS